MATIEFTINENNWKNIKEEKVDFSNPVWIKYQSGNIDLMTHLTTEGFSGPVPVIITDGKLYPKSIELNLDIMTHWQPLIIT